MTFVWIVKFSITFFEGSCERVDLFDAQECFETVPPLGPDSDDTNSIGSRSTSNSLKRWTTEENLSSGKIFQIIISIVVE